MSKNQKKLYISLLIILIFFIFFIIKTEGKSDNIASTQATPLQQKIETSIVNTEKTTKNNSVVEKTIQPKIPESENLKNTQSANLLIGDATDHLSFAPNTIFYDALMQARNAGKIEFSGKNYLGLGFFVTDIGTLHIGNGKNLIYYINGKEATVGVSSYTLKDGDIIEWKLE